MAQDDEADKEERRREGEFLIDMISDFLLHFKPQGFAFGRICNILQIVGRNNCGYCAHNVRHA